jgi:methionyl-tRNA formyltransferase
VRILFAGSPDIAVPSLIRLSLEHEVVGVLTNPESAKGRGMAVAGTSVARIARERFGDRVPILAYERLGPEAREAVAALRPELLASFAYGRIFGPKFLALFPRGGVNVHPSLLPRHRGPTPIQAAILARDTETAVTVQRIALEMDSGDILASATVPLAGRENADDIAEVAAVLGADLLAGAIDDIAQGRERPKPQEGETSYCGMLSKEDGLLDWDAGVLDIDARVRAFSPWPGAFTYYKGLKLDILESFPFPGESYPTDGSEIVADARAEALVPGTILGLDKARGIMVQTKDGLIALKRLRLQNKKALPYKEFANGIRDLAGAVLCGLSERGRPLPEEADRP